MTSTCVRSFDRFEQVSLAQVKDIIIRLKPSSGGFYGVPLHLLKEMSLGQVLLPLLIAAFIMGLLHWALSKRLSRRFLKSLT